MSSNNGNNKNDSRHFGSMAAARNPSTRTPFPSRDGFSLVPNHPIQWETTKTLQDIMYSVSYKDHVARIAFNRPEVLNAFRPTTIREIQDCLEVATDDPQIAVILLDSTVAPHQYTPSFCAGGDQTVRQTGGYQDGSETQPKLRVLDLQIQMFRCPKPIVAVVRGYAIGGGHILHMCSDLTLADTNGVFGQTGPRMGSFDAGYGCVAAANSMGQKRARELWFLCQFYSAAQAKEMGMVNAVAEPDQLDKLVAQWVRRMASHSPTALAGCKAALNAVQDGGAGISQMGGVITNLYYKTDESKEGQQAFLEKRAPHFRSKL